MKYHLSDVLRQSRQSPPARGAWIEMTEFLKDLEEVAVAPREGGVD